VPVVLRVMGVLQYSQALADKVGIPSPNMH
jgi:hypothetical protein